MSVIESGAVSEAVAYAERGLRVIPLHNPVPGGCTCRKGPQCGSAGKHPRLKDWQNQASNDPEVVAKWWEQWPDANVGIVLGGASGVIDLECDNPQAEQDLLELFDGGPPICPSFQANRGKHRLFKWSSNVPGGAVLHYGALEVRTGNGGLGAQSVFPPSRHASGKSYLWLPGCSLDEIDPPELSSAVVAKLWNLTGEDRPAANGNANGTAPKGADHWGRVLSGVAEGGRNEAAASFCGRLLRSANELSNVEIIGAWDLLKTWNSQNAPPLPEVELRQVFDSVLQREQRRRASSGEVPGGAEAAEIDPGSAPTSRDDMLAVVNRTLRGKFGGWLNVTRIEKVGRTGGCFYSILKDGSRVRLGSARELLSVSAVQTSILDQTGILIPLNKKGWPRVVHSIVSLAEIQDVGTVADDVRYALNRFISECSKFATCSESNEPVGSREWLQEKLPKLGRSNGCGCLYGPNDIFWLHFRSFWTALRWDDREIKQNDVKQSLASLGFRAGDKLQIRDQRKRQWEVRVWTHDGGFRHEDAI